MLEPLYSMYKWRDGGFTISVLFQAHKTQPNLIPMAHSGPHRDGGCLIATIREHTHTDSQI